MISDPQTGVADRIRSAGRDAGHVDQVGRPRAAALVAVLRDPARAQIQPKMPPLGRFVQPEEVAALAAFLLGPHGGAMTGQQLVMCGGASL